MLQTPAALPSVLITKQEAVWVSEPVWTWWKTEKNSSPCRKSNSAKSRWQRVTLLSELSLILQNTALKTEVRVVIIWFCAS